MPSWNSGHSVRGVRQSTTRAAPRARRPLPPLELASGELAHGLEHAEARLGDGVVHLHERLIHEVLEQVEHLRLRESLVGYDGLGGVEGERPRTWPDAAEGSCSGSESSE